jgi:hypothetical protein
MTDRSEKGNYIIFHIEGGFGKNVLATAVVEALKNQYPDKKIIIVTGWEEPWFLNPHVERVYRFGNMNYFYEDFVLEDTKILRIDPYHTEQYIKQEDHLVKIWCKLFDIPYNGETPRLYFNPAEIESIKMKLNPDNRPIFAIQTNGGAPNQHMYKSWFRDMPLPFAQKVADQYLKAGYRVLHIKREDQPALNNVEIVTMPLREVMPLFLFTHKRLLIDSFAQHVCAALDLPSVVTWIGNSPDVLGYELHKNIKPKVEIPDKFLKYSYLEKYDISGNPLQYPFENDDIFDEKEIFNALNDLK